MARCLNEIPAFGWQTSKCEYQVTSYEEYINDTHLLPKNSLLTKVEIERRLSKNFRKHQKIQRIKDNLFQLAGCTPFLGLIIGVIRIAVYIFGSSLKTTSHRKNHIFRGVLEIAQMGVLLLMIDAIVTIYRTQQASKHS